MNIELKDNLVNDVMTDLEKLKSPYVNNLNGFVTVALANQIKLMKQAQEEPVEEQKDIIVYRMKKVQALYLKQAFLDKHLFIEIDNDPNDSYAAVKTRLYPADMEYMKKIAPNHKLIDIL